MNYCLGTVQFGLQYGIQNNSKPVERVINEILNAAIMNGINTFDTATIYGDSEIVLGKYFAHNNLNSNNVHVITKVFSKVLDDLNVTEYEDKLNDSIIFSLDRLQINSISGLLFHDSNAVYDESKMKSLINIKGDMVNKVGISIYTPDEALKASEYDIDIIQVPYNLFDNRLDKVGFFEKAKNKNIEIYARSSLLQGLALMDYNRLPKNVEFAKEYLIKFDDLCRKYNIDRLNAAVNYVSSNKYIDYIVFGTDNINQLQEYLLIRDNVLPKEIIEDIKNNFKDVPEKLVNPTLWK